MNVPYGYNIGIYIYNVIMSMVIPLILSISIYFMRGMSGQTKFKKIM